MDAAEAVRVVAEHDATPRWVIEADRRIVCTSIEQLTDELAESQRRLEPSVCDLHGPAHVGDITRLLEDARTGDPAAQEALFELVYPELKVLARQRLRHASALTLLDASSLVHEVYLRLTRQQDVPAGSRRIFFAYASKIMRNVILDYVRERHTLKRGGGEHAVTLHTGDPVMDAREPNIEALDMALQELAQIDERSHQIVEMRYFGGLSIEEISEALDVSPATVKRDWQKARAFLFEALQV